MILFLLALYCPTFFGVLWEIVFLQLVEIPFSLIPIQNLWRGPFGFVDRGLVFLNGRVDSLPEDQYSDWFRCIYYSKLFFITPKAQKGIKGHQYLCPGFFFSPCLHQPQVLLLCCFLAIPWGLQVEKKRYVSFLFVLNRLGNPRPDFFLFFSFIR